MGTKVYFFAGDKYVRYSMTNDKIDSGYSLPIS